MDALAALAAGGLPADISLSGYPLAWVRTTPAWNTGTHRLDRHLFYLVDGGEMAVDCNGSTTLLNAGMALLIPPSMPFCARSGRTAPSFWRMRLALPAPCSGLLIGTGCRHLEPVLTSLLAELDQVPGPVRDAAVRGGLLVLLAGLARASEAAPEDELTFAQRAALERFADGNPRATPRDLMRQLGLTLDYGTRLFRRSYGRPPRRWLLERRMHAAAVRVGEGAESLAAIAEDLGYVDERLFARQFKDVLGLPPGRFRRAARSVSG